MTNVTAGRQGGGVGDRLFIEVPGYRLSKLAKIIVNSKLLQGKKNIRCPLSARNTGLKPKGNLRFIVNSNYIIQIM